MLTAREYNVKLDDKRAYIADENGKVFVADYRPGDYGYVVKELVSGKDKGSTFNRIDNPTQGQLENALLNLILEDNNTNRNKTGLYSKDIDQIFDEFISFMSRAKDEYSRISTSAVFSRFGLNPRGEYWQGATNGLIKDVLKGLQHKSDKAYDYVFRGPQKFDSMVYNKDENGDVYVVDSDYANYEYKIYKIVENNLEEVENPTQDQLKNALLNLVIKDNFTNPSKTGMYNLDIEQIEDCFGFALNKIQKSKLSAEEFSRLFGIHYDGELMWSASTKLIEDVVSGLQEESERI